MMNRDRTRILPSRDRLAELQRNAAGDLADWYDVPLTSIHLVVQEWNGYSVIDGAS